MARGEDTWKDEPLNVLAFTDDNNEEDPIKENKKF